MEAVDCPTSEWGNADAAAVGLNAAKSTLLWNYLPQAGIKLPDPPKPGTTYTAPHTTYAWRKLAFLVLCYAVHSKYCVLPMRVYLHACKVGGRGYARMYVKAEELLSLSR